MQELEETVGFRIATPRDAPAVAALINAAFGGDGWTSEAQLVNGDRTDAGEIARMMRDSKLAFLLLAELGGRSRPAAPT